MGRPHLVEAGFSATTEMHGSDGVIITLVGDLDVWAASTLCGVVSAAIAVGPSWVVLDLTGITFIDSTGLSELIHSRQRGEDFDVTVSVRSVPRFVRRVFDLLDAWHWFALEPDNQATAGERSPMPASRRNQVSSRLGLATV